MRRMLRNTFLGHWMQQEASSLVVFEQVLRATPFERIIELGTGWGGLSLFFALRCLRNGVQFHTFDIAKKWESSQLTRMSGMEGGFQVLDILDNGDVIRSLIQRDGISILFCDNGNKPEEFRMFVPALKPGDIIGVHDWGREIMEKDVKELVDEYKLEAVELDLCRKVGTSVRLWKKG